MREIKIQIILGSVGNTEWWTEKDWEEHKNITISLKKRVYLVRPYPIL